MASIRTLKIFLAIVKHGSFAAAGREIGLTPAAVGLQMRALEEDLGRTLFDRTGRSIVLNTAGRQAAGDIAALVGRYEELCQADADDLSGTVFVGALVSSLMGAFGDGLWALKQAYPRLDVKLFGGLSSDFSSKVAGGELDAAIVTRSPQGFPATVVWSPLYTEQMVLIAPRRPRFAMGDDPIGILAGSPFLRFDRDTWTGALVDAALQQVRAPVTEAMELNSVEAIVELVRQGYGVSIVPKLDNVQWARDRSVRVIDLPGKPVFRHVGLLERKHHSRQRFTEALKQYFKVRGKGGAVQPARAGAGRRR